MEHDAAKGSIAKRCWRGRGAILMMIDSCGRVDKWWKFDDQMIMQACRFNEATCMSEWHYLEDSLVRTQRDV